jgi:hypothetical protein
MAQGPDQTKFEALIRNSLVDAINAWAKERGKLSNSQIGEAMFRLFLAAPNWVRLLAFVASPEELQSVPEETWRQIVERMSVRAKSDEAGEIVAEAERNAQSGRSARDRPKGKAAG